MTETVVVRRTYDIRIEGTREDFVAAVAGLAMEHIDPVGHPVDDEGDAVGALTHILEALTAADPRQWPGQATFEFPEVSFTIESSDDSFEWSRTTTTQERAGV